MNDVKSPDRSMTVDTGKYKRNENDFYETPDWCTRVLLKQVDFRGPILEPACGNLAIVDVMKSYFMLSSDMRLTDRLWYSDLTYGFDFLESDATVDNIITNPPYNISEIFVRHALDLAQDKVAMLLRNEWDCAKSRVDLFSNVDKPSNFYKKIVLTKRPKWIKNSTGSPRHNYAWYVWKKDYFGSPVIEYARINKDT